MSNPKNPPPPPPHDADALDVDVDLDSPRVARAWVHVAIDLQDGSTLEITAPATGGGVAGYHPTAPDEGPALWLTVNGRRRRAKLGPLLAKIAAGSK